MKRRLQRFFQIALLLFVFSMTLLQLKAQPIGSQIRIGADSTISYWNGSAWIAVAHGLPGQSLRFTNGVPAWISTAIIDIDGNGYDTVRIGTQTWMKQNLNVTHFNNGNAIPNITDNTAWNNLNFPISASAYCNYNNDTNNGNTYGRLYNYYSITNNLLCPIGWHVPSDAEWSILTTYLGGENIAGDKLKETGLTHWVNPISSATNITNFTALPGGDRLNNGTFEGLGWSGSWWSSTEVNTWYSSWCRTIVSNVSDVSRNSILKVTGVSVRCLKD